MIQKSKILPPVVCLLKDSIEYTCLSSLKSTNPITCTYQALTQVSPRPQPTCFGSEFMPNTKICSCNRARIYHHPRKKHKKIDKRKAKRQIIHFWEQAKPSQWERDQVSSKTRNCQNSHAIKITQIPNPRYALKCELFCTVVSLLFSM